MTRFLSAVLAVSLTAAAALVAPPADVTAGQMARAASAFLASLPAELRDRTVFPVDSPERLKWDFVPLQDRDRNPTRRGARLELLTAEQKELALALLATGTSSDGWRQAVEIMSLESVLHVLEGGRGNVRNPDWYFVTVFGAPGAASRWGWRFEGHHLSINYLCAGGRVVSWTPCFFGANPAVVREGPKRGFKPLQPLDDVGRRLFASLDAGQREQAHQKALHPEVTATPAAAPGEPVGVAARDLTPEQKAVLDELIDVHLKRFPDAVAAAERRRITANRGAVRFSLAGSPEAGRPTTYRVHGPNFLIEFLNQQNAANHIHSAWRALPRDFEPLTAAAH